MDERKVKYPVMERRQAERDSVKEDFARLEEVNKGTGKERSGRRR